MSKRYVDKIISHDHHRNGVMGTPFNVAIFESEGQRMLGIFTDKELDAEVGNVNCFVLDLDLAAAGDIRFGSNSWRGDNFADELRTMTATPA